MTEARVDLLSFSLKHEAGEFKPWEGHDTLHTVQSPDDKSVQARTAVTTTCKIRHVTSTACLLRTHLPLNVSQ